MLKVKYSYNFLSNESKLRNGTKTFLEPKFYLFLVKFKKLEFIAPLIPELISFVYPVQHDYMIWVDNIKKIIQTLVLFSGLKYIPRSY